MFQIRNSNLQELFAVDARIGRAAKAARIRRAANSSFRLFVFSHPTLGLRASGGSFAVHCARVRLLEGSNWSEHEAVRFGGMATWPSWNHANPGSAQSTDSSRVIVVNWSQKNPRQSSETTPARPRKTLFSAPLINADRASCTKTITILS